jgi:RNA-directed DNA polymerase
VRRQGKLYDRICAVENVRVAHAKARKGKGHYSEVKMIDATPEIYFTEIGSILREKRFRNGPYTVFKRIERGKEREIYKLPYYPDRIVHHCIMNVLETIWKKIFIRDTFASMPKRGIHDGLRRLKKFLKNETGTSYCLKFDIQKFYPSIDHGILKEVIRKSIKCKDTLWLLDSIIDSAPGVPIGNYLSQYFANLYLAYFDHWAKERLGVKYYLRYCDDVVILHSDKAVLHQWKKEIESYLSEQLKLRIKPNWQVFPTRIRGIDFLGYRFFGDYTLIRKHIAKRFKRTAATIRKRAPRLPHSKVVNGIMSYYGWCKYGDAHNLWKAIVDIKLMDAFDKSCEKNRVGNPLRRLVS